MHAYSATVYCDDDATPLRESRIPAQREREQHPLGRARDAIDRVLTSGTHAPAARSCAECLMYSSNRFPNVSGGNGGFASRKFNLRRPAAAAMLRPGEG